MRGLIGYENAGYQIIEAKFYNGTNGYCIGKTKEMYVTWWFAWADESKLPTFYHGHYFQIDHDAPLRSAAQVAEDYHRRLMEAFKNIKIYGHN